MRVVSHGRANTARAGVRLMPVLAALLVALPAPASASRVPTKTEKRAIQKAFFAKHPRSGVRVRQIRVARVDNRFAAVLFRVRGRSGRASRRVSSPAYFKAAGTRFKAISRSKVPTAVRKSLGKPARRVASDIKITGAYTADLTQPATCTRSSGYYAVTVWDRKRDVAFRLQVSEYSAPGGYDVREVGTIAQVLVGNRVTYPNWESTYPPQGTPKGTAFIHSDGLSGTISADLAPQPPESSPRPETLVHVSGKWACG